MDKTKNKQFPWFTDAAWLDQEEGQLAVDVIEDNKKIIIRSAIAGVSPRHLDISVTNDTVTIRGRREIDCEESTNATTHIKECHWGNFSRSIVLPAHVRSDKAEAKLKNGILTLTIPKIKPNARVEIQEID